MNFRKAVLRQKYFDNVMTRCHSVIEPLYLGNTMYQYCIVFSQNISFIECLMENQNIDLYFIFTETCKTLKLTSQHFFFVLLLTPIEFNQYLTLFGKSVDIHTCLRWESNPSTLPT